MSGLSDYGIEDDNDAGSSSGSSSSSSSGSSGSSSGGEPDSGTPAPPPTCACVDRPPAGWSDPIALLENDGQERACPTGLTTKLHGGTNATAPTPGCEACVCTLQGGACGELMLQPNNGGSCSNGCTNALKVTATCGNYGFCGSNGSMKLTSFDGGSCQPTGGARRTAAFGHASNACGFDPGQPIPNGGCTGNQMCAPKSAGAPDAKTCIVHDGDATCPAGSPYNVHLLFQSTINDTRTCSACTCGASTAACVGGVITVYNDMNCNQVVGTVSTAPNSCGTHSGATDPVGGAKLTTLPAIDGGCPPSGGQVTSGNITQEGPWTACCLP